MDKPKKIHTTNYTDTFIEVADDYPLATAKTPELHGEKKKVAAQQYELLVNNPYKYTSDDILFQVYADRNQLEKADYEEARAEFFSKGQACFRASPLTKSHGFGVHSDRNGKLAIYPRESEAYENFRKDPEIKKLKAMRSSKK